MNPLHLRLVTHAQNGQHRTRPNTNSPTGYRGVRLCKQTGRWAAGVTLNGRHHWLGRHPTPERAHAVVAAFLAEHAPHSEYGDGGRADG